MAVPVQSIEELLSISYVTAVAVKAGVTFDLVRRDFGVDLSIRQIKSFGGKLMDMGVLFDCQLKASINWIQEQDNIAYDLDVMSYNKLVWRYQEPSTPCILLLLCLPRDQNQWLNLTEEQLILRKCCYWTRITGPESPNKSSVRIRIPRSQMFTPDVIRRLISKIKRGESI